MRVALIADIHGNLFALEAVLQELAKKQVEHIICMGDVAAGGPQPLQVIERLQQLACPVVMGNTDAFLLEPQVREPKSLFAQRCQAIDLWCAQQLSDEHKAYIRTFQPTITWTFPHGKTLLAYHGSPRSFREQILATTPDEVLEQAFAGFQADIMAGAHTHAQMFRRYRDILVLNPGSVGLPMDRVSPLDKVRNPPWAEYAIVNAEENALNVELCRTPFDIHAFIQATLTSGMPNAEWSASEWII